MGNKTKLHSWEMLLAVCGRALRGQVRVPAPLKAMGRKTPDLTLDRQTLINPALHLNEALQETGHRWGQAHASRLRPGNLDPATRADCSLQRF